MKEFRFVILGAGNIAGNFVKAVEMIDGCSVCAVASKSMERAKQFAEKNGIPNFYDDYEKALIYERPDAAYIAVTANDHYRLSMLCVKHGVPILCEKAMFRKSEEAVTLFEEAERNNIFVMEALWSRFLPTLKKAKEKINSGAVGTPVFAEISIGFRAPEDRTNRYFNPDLGGGTAYDLVCYGYEILMWILEREAVKTQVIAARSDTGVDASTVISMLLEGEVPAVIKCSFMASLDEGFVLYGTEGKIVIPHPHYANEYFFYDKEGKLNEHYRDEETKNGFVYEIKEVTECVRLGKNESEVVPHADTLKCSCIFDRILEELKR